jgi:hypothetical protein
MKMILWRTIYWRIVGAAAMGRKMGRQGVVFKRQLVSEKSRIAEL